MATIPIAIKLWNSLLPQIVEINFLHERFQESINFPYIN